MNNYATAIPLGSVITLGIFLLMTLLIANAPSAATVEPRRTPVNWIHVDPPEDLVIDDYRYDELKQVEKTPPTRVPDTTEHTSGGISVPGSLQPPTPGGFALSGLNHDGPLVAVMKVEPTYPPRAIARGLEGYVVVAFDVMPDGTVANVSIVDSSSSLFHEAARKAALRFRYKARVIDGVPVTTSGIRNLFRFTMKD